MRAGTLRTRVVIQAATASQDTFGGESKTWTTLATVWGEVKPLSGREYMQARQAQADVTTRITIRYRDDITITPACRITWNGHTYDVKDVIHDAQQRQYQLMCAEVIG